MGWGYTPGPPGVASSVPVYPVVRPPTGREADAPFDVAIVCVVLLSVLSLIGHAVPWYRWVAGSPSITVAGPAARPAPTLTPGSAPTSGPTSTAAPSTPSPSPSAAAAAPLAVPPTPVVDAVCLRADNPRTGAKLPAGDPFGDDVRRLGAGAKLLRLFAVQGGALVPADGLGAPRRCDQQLWALVTTLAPTQVKYLDQFLVFDSGSGESGGVKVGESAPKRVAARQYDAAHWRLSLAPNRMDRADLAWLVAHELAHIASLNVGQLSQTARSCSDELTFTGCLSEGSYLKRYLAKGWPEDLMREWRRADDKSTSDQSALRTFFRAHRSSFVTAYAATHPDEDFAESFAMWCTYAADEPTRAQLPKGAPSDSGSKVEWFATLTTDLAAEFDPGCQALRKFAVT